MLKLKYIFHSGFLITTERVRLLIDYWKGLDGLDALTDGGSPLYVLASHAHHDHYNPEILSLKGSVTRVFSSDVPAAAADGVLADVRLRPGDVFDDGSVFIRAYGSTDEGVSFVIRLDGYLIFHAGDLNNWHWSEESTDEEIAEMESRYLAVLDEIAWEYPAFDVVMFPIDPRMAVDIERGARQFLERIKTGMLIPMHFGTKYTGSSELGVEMLVPERNTEYDIHV